MHQNKGHNIIFTCWLTFLLIWSSKFFNLSTVDATTYGRLSYLIYGSIICIFAIKFKAIIHIHKPLNIIVICLIIGMLLSIIFGESSIAQDVNIIKQIPLFLVFYILYAYKISTQKLLRIVTTLGIVIFIIQIIQIAFPDLAIFGIYSDDDIIENNTFDKAEIRNGIFRYRYESYFISILCFFYYWSKMLNHFSLKNIASVLLFALSICLYMTRNIMLSTFAVAVLSLCFNHKATKSRNHILRLSIIFITLLIILFQSQTIFSDLIEQTQTDLDTDNIRLASFVFYWEKICTSTHSFLFGYGHPLELQTWQEDMHLYPSDIGFIGEWFHYGICWIIIYFTTIFILLIKYRKQIPFFIKIYIWEVAIMSILIFPYRFGYEYVIWAIVLYIASISIKLKPTKIFRHSKSLIKKTRKNTNTNVQQTI